MISFATLVLAFILGCVLYVLLYKRKDGDPPGPVSFPIVGNALQLGKKPHKSFAKFAKKYGDIMTIDFGPNKSVVISDPKLLREIFNDPVFSGRVQEELFLVFSKGSYGVISSQKDTWENQRRFALRHLRDFGFGKSSMEVLIMEEVKEILERFKENLGKPVRINRSFSLAVLNSLWTILTGKRNSQDDPKLQALLSDLMKTGEEAMENGILMFFPWLLKLAPNLTKFNKFVDLADKAGQVITETMNYHKKTLPADGEARDFIDLYMHEINKTKDPSSSFYGETGDKNLYALISDLFQAGAETTSSTLTWAMLYLGGHPEAQQRLQQEIDNVVGKSKFPSLQDRPNMPYTEAVIMEVMRKSSIVPLGVQHTALADANFHGYKIEKGTWIFTNIYGMHHDPRFWEDPEEFRPSRFLNSDGKLQKNEALVPFSVGKRQCLGETLARDSLFLFITSIFQKFSVKIHLPNGGKPDYEPTIAFLLSPKKFHVILNERN